LRLHALGLAGTGSLYEAVDLLTYAALLRPLDEENWTALAWLATLSPEANHGKMFISVGQAISSLMQDQSL
jgi:hypothetical protein